MAHAKTRLAELIERLAALDRERATILTEIEALSSTPEAGLSRQAEPHRRRSPSALIGSRRSKQRLPYSAGFSVVALKFFLFVGKTPRLGAAATHRHVKMNGGAASVKSPRSNARPA